MSPPKVFLSYSHDSEAHRERVLALSERLIRDGIDARIDRYVNGSPPRGWPAWMLDQIEWADFVLLICTEAYYRRFRGRERNGGKGVNFEGVVVSQEFYNDHCSTTKFVPTLFARGDEKFIPELLRGHTFYLLETEEGYWALYDFLLGQAAVEPGPLGPIRHRERKRPKPLTFEDAASNEQGRERREAELPGGAEPDDDPPTSSGPESNPPGTVSGTPLTNPRRSARKARSKPSKSQMPWPLLVALPLTGIGLLAVADVGQLRQRAMLVAGMALIGLFVAYLADRYLSGALDLMVPWLKGTIRASGSTGILALFLLFAYNIDGDPVYRGVLKTRCGDRVKGAKVDLQGSECGPVYSDLEGNFKFAPRCLAEPTLQATVTLAAHSCVTNHPVSRDKWNEVVLTCGALSGATCNTTETSTTNSVTTNSTNTTDVGTTNSTNTTDIGSSPVTVTSTATSVGGATSGSTTTAGACLPCSGDQRKMIDRQCSGIGLRIKSISCTPTGSVVTRTDRDGNPKESCVTAVRCRR